MGITTIDSDRISQLPDHIIHHILTFLPTPEVVRLSVLSKAWNGYFTCFPMSEFSEPSLPSKASDRKLKFANFVYSSLLRQCLYSTRIPKFKFSVCDDYYYNSTSPELGCESTDLINQSIGLSIQYGVKELSLHFRDSMKYRLPEAIFSAKELVVFRLAGSSLENTINWPSLRQLSLRSVYISDHRIIDNLIVTCPLIEEFSLVDCTGITHLKLLGFTKLKEVRIEDSQSNCLLEKIEIDSLSLQTFSCCNSHCPGKEVSFALNACKNLEVLKFFGYTIDQNVEYLISSFPALKVLVLPRYVSQKIEISSLQLEKLQCTESLVKDIVINAPRLQSFKYELGKLPSLFLINKANLHEVSLRLDLADLYYRYGIHFLKYLMEFLRNFNPIKLLILNISNWACYEIREIFRSFSHPVFLDICQFKLEIIIIDKIEEDFEALVDYFFRMRHPESLVLVKSGWCLDDEGINVLCKKLVEYRVKDLHCCTDNYVQCWRHDLKGIKIEHYGEDGDREVVTREALLDSMHPLVLKKNIRFAFDW